MHEKPKGVDVECELLPLELDQLLEVVRLEDRKFLRVDALSHYKLVLVNKVLLPELI